MPRGRTWPVVVRTWWCPECNVPLLSKNCNKCGGQGFELKLAEPGDVRPAFPYDLEMIREAMRYDLGVDAYDKLIGEGKVVLLNKNTHLDDAKDIVVDGNVIGQVFFDPFTFRWRFRPYYPAAKLIVEDGLGRVVKLSPGQRVRSGSYLDWVDEKPGTMLLVARHDGEPLGLAYVLSDGRVRVHKLLRPKGVVPTSGRRASMDDVLKANEYMMYYMESRGRKLLYVMAEKVGKPVVVSFSGGKDSLVSLHMTLATIGEPIMLFNDTGVELPETVECVHRTAERYGLELVKASAGDALWVNAPRYGPPARDYRWCCKVLKLVPLARVANRLWPNGALNVVGQRAFESLDRARSPRVWRNRYIPTLLSVTPIQEWGQLAVWLYIHKYKLETNPLYFRGFDRIGCFMCPACRLAEFEEVRKAHPEIWGKWEVFLYKWAERIGVSEGWVRLGLWRWLINGNVKRLMAAKAGVAIEPWTEIYRKWIQPSIAWKSVEVQDGSCRVVVRLTSPIPLDAVLDQVPLLGDSWEADDSEVKVTYNAGSVSFSREGLIVVEHRGSKECAYEKAIDALKVLYRGLLCSKCMSCTIWCPEGAVKVTDHPVVDADLCRKCRVCLEVCLISDVIVEHVIAALLLDDPRAWRRPWRTLRKDVMRKIKALIVSSASGPRTS